MPTHARPIQQLHPQQLHQTSSGDFSSIVEYKKLGYKKLLMRLYLSICCSAFSTLTVAVDTDSPLQSIALLGSDGVGIHFAKALHPKLSARLGFNTLGLDVDFSTDDIDYEAEFSQHSINAILDWHPWENGFYSSIGLTSSQTDLQLESVSAAEYDIGGNNYQGSIQLLSTVKLPKVNPYFGIGWRRQNETSRLQIGFDLGALWISDLDVSMSAKGSITDGGLTLNVNLNEAFQADIQAEKQSLENELKDSAIYPWIPIARFGFGYRF